MSSLQSNYVRDMIRKAELWNKPLYEIRKNMEEMESGGVPEGIKNVRETVGGVTCEAFYCERAAEDKLILYFHGGGFCMGIYSSNRDFVAGISKKCGINLYMPDYRLAPENPFPAALEDAIAVYQGFLTKGYQPENIVIMGDSSGGALSVSALLQLKQKGIPMPKALAYITPVFDLLGKGETYSTRRLADPFSQEDPLNIAKIYVSDNDASSPLLSPLYGDLTGLPPVLLHSGDYDVFLGDSIRFAEAIKSAGVRVEYKNWEEMWHIFHMQAAFVPESELALTQMCDYIRKELN